MRSKSRNVTKEHRREKKGYKEEKVKANEEIINKIRTEAGKEKERQLECFSGNERVM